MKFRIFFLLIFFSIFSGVMAQPAEDDDVFSLKSPYHTVYSHLYYLQNADEQYKPAVAAKTLNIANPKQAKQLAVELKHILDGKGLYVDLDELPTNNNYTDSASGKHKYVLFREYPQIYVEKVGDKWYYSERTVEAIPELHKEVFPFGTDKLISLVPKIGQKKVLGLAVWKHMGILIFIFISFVVYKVFTWIFRMIVYRVVSKLVDKENSTKVVRSVSKSLALLIVLLLLNLFIPVLQLPIKVSHYLFLSLKAFVPFIVMLILYKAVDVLGVYLEGMAERTESTLDDQVVPLVKKSLKIFVVVSGVLFILQNLEFDITALLAGISIGGLAFALAAQDTIKNLFGSLMIFVDRPFQVGDWIVAPDIDGSVESVGFRSTRIRTFHNSLIAVPNGKLADMTIDNMGLRSYRRYSTKLTVTYDTPPDLLEAFVEGVEKIVVDHPQTWKGFYQVKVNDFGAHSINILLYLFFDVPDWATELKCREEIILSVKRLAAELNVRFAFPTSTIHVEDFPEKESLTPHYEEDKEGFNKKVAAFFGRSKS